jgi:hypothetical protein
VAFAPLPRPQVLALLPFSLLSMLVFSLAIYGMAGLRRSGPAAAQHASMAVLAYLCASQVGWRVM